VPFRPRKTTNMLYSPECQPLHLLPELYTWNLLCMRCYIIDELCDRGGRFLIFQSNSIHLAPQIYEYQQLFDIAGNKIKKYDTTYNIPNNIIWPVNKILFTWNSNELIACWRTSIIHHHRIIYLTIIYIRTIYKSVKWVGYRGGCPIVKSYVRQ